MREREPLQIIEIDQDFCTLTYGAAPCTAVLGTTGDHKCFNTARTCQDRTNYTRGALTLRFSKPQAGIPKGTTIFPVVQSVASRPTVINIGGSDGSTGPLGRRARTTVKMRDFPYHDRYTDKYARERVTGAAQADSVGYDPQDRSTFWVKWRARNPYYQGRSLRVLDGYVGQPLEEMRTSHYVIETMIGPDSGGNVTFVAKDVLKLADDDRAVAPKPNNGELATGIDAVATTFNLSPTGIGNAEYPASGTGVLSSEIVEFTRTGDAITLVERGARGTDADKHEAGDRFQVALTFSGALISDVLKTLLVDYGNVPAQFIPDAEWQAEAEAFLSGFLLNATIPEPTGVTRLIGEISELGPYIWWDEIAQKIRLQANRQPDAAAKSLEEGRHFIADSAEVTDKPDQRVTQVWVRFSQRDPTKRRDEAGNYAQWIVYADPAAQSGAEFGDQRIRRINSRWLPNGSKGVATNIAGRILARHRDTPRLLKFDMDAKDRSLWTGDVFEALTRKISNAVAEREAEKWQVISAEEVQSGHKLRYIAKSYDWLASADDEGETTVIISDNTTDLNLRALYDSLYGVVTESVKFIIEAGVLASSSSVSTPAVIVGDWPESAAIVLTNNGIIAGRHGGAGDGGYIDNTSVPGGPGSKGGNGLYARRPITLQNGDGIIGSGGGGGGGGGGAMSTSSLDIATAGGGGGGGAAPLGSGGAGGPALDGQARSPGKDGSAAGAVAGGAGGDGGHAVRGGATATGGKGGAGGGLGEAGQAGGAGTGNAATTAGGAGGATGDAAIDGVSFVTFDTAGTVYGAQIN